MPDPRLTNRTMFWRIIRRMIAANRQRLFVLLLALGAGATITAALLNLEVDAKRRLTTEFRAFGPNIVVAPRDANETSAEPSTLDESLLNQVRAAASNQANAIGYLYVIADVSQSGDDSKKTSVVLAGQSDRAALGPAPSAFTRGLPLCDVGRKPPLNSR